jgi:hypothetical protein
LALSTCEVIADMTTGASRDENHEMKMDSPWYCIAKCMIVVDADMDQDAQ